ncbi:MAG: hypothetical protein EOL90_08665 [Spartobacteria bacterium]|nr:hypothetical protein [Spartobacteria bacterium]
MKRLILLALAFFAAATSQGWEVKWFADNGFVRPDGVTPIFANDTGANTVQLLFSTNNATLGQRHADWIAGSGGSVNPRSDHVVLATAVVTPTFFGFASPDGVFELNYSNALFRSGYVFVRVFNVGSDDPANLAAFANYYESPLVPTFDGRQDLPVNSGSANLDPFTTDILDYPGTPAPIEPQIVAIGFSPDHFPQVQLISEPGISYALQYTTNILRRPQIWANAASQTGTGGLVTLTDGNATDPKRFYRVVVP